MSTILIVDDELPLRRVISQALRQAGHVTLQAGIFKPERNTNETLAEIKKNCYPWRL